MKAVNITVQMDARKFRALDENYEGTIEGFIESELDELYEQVVPPEQQLGIEGDIKDEEKDHANNKFALICMKDKDEEWDDETKAWSYIEKYVPTKNGKMENTYTYYLIKDKVVYFERGRYGDTFDGYVSSMSLNLPIPFEVGDIVVLNCLPFAPVKVALLTEVENGDCCGVQMLYNDTDGEWKTGALKHGHGWGNYYPLLSPLYRLEKLELKARKPSKLLKEDEEGLLRELQKSLRKDIRNE